GSASQDQKGQKSGESKSQEKSEPSQGDQQSKLVEALKKRQQEQEEAAKQQTERADKQARDSDPLNAPSTQEIFAPLQAPVTNLIKWAIYGLFALAVLYSLWRYRADVVAAIRNFLRELSAWWQALWGGKRDYGLAPDEVLDLQALHAPFSSYA